MCEFVVNQIILTLIGTFDSYHKKHAFKSSETIVSYTYICAQSKQYQKKVKKSPDPAAQRDRQRMASFECGGHVVIQVDEQKFSQHVDVTINHNQNHVPYCSVSLPSDVKDLIENSLDKTPTQVQLLKIYIRIWTQG